MSSLTTKLNCRSLHQYLSDLPSAILDALYENSATCMAVFRELPELAKHYVMRVLFVDVPISVPAISSWITKEAKNDHKDSVDILSQLRIWIQVSLKGGLPAYNLSDTFRSSLKKALIGGGHLMPTTIQLEPDKNSKSPDSLEKYASERWEVLLHYLVGTQVAAVSGDIKDLMLQCGLMRVDKEEGRDSVFITAKGFQFLLLDTPTQVWFFILEYLEWVRKRGMNLVPILKFLFELSFASLGMDLPSDGRDEHVIQCLQHLREIGLVFQRKRTSRRFYPTNLAINLVNRQSTSFVTAKSRGFIIAETNYRVYSYTTSDLQYAIMSLFSEMLYRLPNLCIGQMTRESVQMAVSHGISAEQILHYLRSNAHPQMLQKELQALMWQNEAKRYMVVNKLAHDQVKKFWKKHKKETAPNDS